MLTDEVYKSPRRPLPPAKLRRVAAQQVRAQWQPPSEEVQLDTRDPPPYAPVSPELGLNTDDLSPSPQRENIPSLNQSSPELYELMHQCSKGELEELLQRAGTIIREREQELIQTSETCRSLSESSAALRSQNNSLIARLPTSRPTSPSPSSTQSISSFPESNSSLRSRRRGHMRWPSSTPAELARLADQNAELLNKLQDFEEESAKADLAGKRRLKNLERDIQTLKEELDKTRAASERMEVTLQTRAERTSSGLPEGLDEDLLKLWKKLIREAKVRELKARTRPWEGDEEYDQPRDFAPGSAQLGSTRTSPEKKESSDTMKMDSTPQTPSASNGSVNESDASLRFSPSSLSVASGANFLEKTLITKLLSKVAELEETNTLLATQHLEACLKLRQAEQETETVKKLCDFINDEVNKGVELEMVFDDDDETFDASPSSLERSPRKTIRLRSVTRKMSLNFDSLRVSESSQDADSPTIRKSTSLESLMAVRSRRKRQHISDKAPEILEEPFGGSHRSKLRPRKVTPKSRRSVLGLFDENTESTAASRSDHFSTSEDLTIVDEEVATNEHILTPRMTASQTGSSDFISDQPPLAQNTDLRSLGNELNGDIGFNLGYGPSVLRARSPSILELLRKSESSAVSVTSPSPSLSRSPSNISNNKEVELSLRSRHPKRSSSRLNFSEEIISPSIHKKESNLFTVQSHSTDDNSVSHRSGKSQNQSPDLSPRADKQEDKPMSMYTTFIVELWLWLQFAVVVVVFLFTMARIGPKSFFQRPEPNKSKS